MDTSPFDDILNTNAILSDAECQRIHDLLAGPRKNLSGLMDEISRIQAELDQLTQKRVELEGFIHAHEALLSPMRRLPDDTLRDIFLAALPSARCATLSTADPPLLLCHISQRWRSLALSTPGLWASLHIAMPPIEDERTAHSAKLGEIGHVVKDWLSRSGALPLSISLLIYRSASGYYPIQQLLTIFIQYSRRWKSIRLDFPSHYLFAGLQVLRATDVPLMRSAIISGFDSLQPGPEFSADPDTLSYLSFLDVPDLKRLSLQSGYYYDLHVHWDALKHLSFRTAHLSQTDAVEALRQCPALEACTITIDTFSHDSESTSPRPCYLGQLRRLSVEDNAPQSTFFFQSLVLPNLHCLEYTYSVPLWDPRVPLACFAVLPSAPCLETLHLRVSTATTDALVAGLRLAPMLREFRISGEPPILDNRSPFPEYDPGLIPLLTPTPGEPMLCPRLQHITLSHFSSMSDAALLAFLLARTDPSLPVDARLTSARVRIDRPPDADIDIGLVLQQRIADGLQLSLEYGEFPRQQLYRQLYYPYSTATSRTSGKKDEDHDWNPIFFEWQPLMPRVYPPPPI
ncbi:F-box domain-containing protein [Mycena sanguinolenta]|uniref:F-box domain-containing protein n=1 Tax=Mycena sanguinolenta TaxID=230812 RepID=A0A8H7DIB6_9AGAR|nr:F-box domain-containing protein [Mycena sanguinolenta]